MADLQTASEEIRDNLESAEAELADAIAAAEDAEAIAHAKARKEIRAAKNKLNEARQELNAREAEVAARGQKVSGAEQNIENNTFGDGVWHVGVDMDAGTYRSPGGASCYWAVLDSANTGIDHIINNGGFSANQTIELLSGQWFETTNCGQFVLEGGDDLPQRCTFSVYQQGVEAGTGSRSCRPLERRPPPG